MKRGLERKKRGRLSSAPFHRLRSLPVPQAAGFYSGLGYCSASALFDRGRVFTLIPLAPAAASAFRYRFRFHNPRVEFAPNRLKIELIGDVVDVQVNVAVNIA